MGVLVLRVKKNDEIVESIGIAKWTTYVYFELDVSDVDFEHLRDIEQFIEDDLWIHDSEAGHAVGEYGPISVSIEEVDI